MTEQREGRRLIRRLAVGSLVAFLATGLGVAALMARTLRSQAQSEATLRARTVAVNVIAPLLVPVDLERPVTGQRYQDLVALVRSRVLSDGRVVRVKVWRPDGTIVFSDDPRAVGLQYPGGDLTEAIRGDVVVSDVSNLSAAENADERVLA